MLDSAKRGPREGSSRLHDYRALFERHWGDVFRVVLSVMGEEFRGEAEDVAQEVFVEGFEQLGQLRDRGAFGAWIRRIAWRRAIDRRRLARFRFVHESSEREPDPRGDETEEKLSVKQALERLGERERSAIHMFYWLGMSIAEIARALSMPEGTIKSDLSRARTKLARRLEKASKP